MVKVSELTDKQIKNWRKLVDELILDSDGDKPLKEGLHYLDNEARRRKVDIYDMMLQLYDKAVLEEKLEDYQKEKRYK